MFVTYFFNHLGITNRKNLNRRFQPYQILKILIHQIANKHIKTYYYSCIV